MTEIEYTVGILRLVCLFSVFFGGLLLAGIGPNRFGASLMTVGVLCFIAESVLSGGLFGFLLVLVLVATVPLIVTIILYVVQKIVLRNVEKKYGSTGEEVKFEPLKIYKGALDMIYYKEEK